MSSDSNMGSDPSTTPNLDRTPCMFAVKQFQRAAPSPEVDSGPSNVYTVHPSAIWDNLERFKHFDIEDEHYHLHDIVAVTRHDLPNSLLWTAHILEIRGHKPTAQVFLRVFWFHHPLHLPPNLRHPHHGRRELLASNAMAVVDATTIARRAHVSHWHEELDPEPAAGLFWRQTYDAQAQKLSPLHTPCPPPCTLPQNPDAPLLTCPLPPCAARMHKPCILAALLSRLRTAQADAAAVSATKAKNAKAPPALRAEWTDGGYGARVTEGTVG